MRYPKVEAEDADYKVDVKTRHIDGTDMTLLTNIDDGSRIGLKNIDLKGIKDLRFKASALVAGSIIEVRAGSPGGQLLGRAEVSQVEAYGQPMKVTTAPIVSYPGKQGDLYFVFRNSGGKKENIAIVDWIFFDNGKMKIPE